MTPTPTSTSLSTFMREDLAPPVDIRESGEVVLAAELLTGVLTAALFVLVLWLLFRLLVNTWRVLLLALAGIFIACWLPTQCDTATFYDGDVFYENPYAASGDNS